MIKHRKWITLVVCAMLTLTSLTAIATASETEALPPAAETTEPNSSFFTSLIENVISIAQNDAQEAAAQTDEAVTLAAPAEQTPAEEPNLIKVYLNGLLMTFDTAPVVIGQNTYVPLRAFCEQLGCTVSWNGDKKTVTVTKGAELNMSLQLDTELVNANDRFFYMPGKCMMVDGSTMVPIRGMAKVFTLVVGWNADTKNVTLSGGTPLAPAASFYSADDLLWMSRIIQAESGSEPFEGKLAVGSVVMHRIESPKFPNSVYDVIFDKKNGTQFTPTKGKAIYKTPSSESIMAAKLCLEGCTNVDGAMYFVNTNVSPNSWAARNRTVLTKIGSHTFFN